jgi:hypothetical protein
VVLRHSPGPGRRDCLHEIGANVPAQCECLREIAANGPGQCECLREIGAGMEEEGVPYRTETVSEGRACELAFAAALASSLDVGVGVDGEGNICVHHAKLPPDAPALAGPASSGRVMGHNAARLVTGIPFKNV